MQYQMTIPDEAIRYILFQRSYFRLPVTFLYRHLFSRLPFPVPVYNLAVAVESRFGSERIKRCYQEDMVAEYGVLIPALPDTCSAVLDIGCGVAGIDVLLDRHYANQRPHFYLLDRSQVDTSVYYLFKPRAAFYNSMEVARDLLTCNGVDSDRIHLLSANERNEVAVSTRIDLVISLLSWGFHYPVAAYYRQVHDLLSEDGVAILDMRKGTDGLDVLRRAFRHVEMIWDTRKFQRVAVRL